jgi:hypothetical protein
VRTATSSTHLQIEPKLPVEVLERFKSAKEAVLFQMQEQHGHWMVEKGITKVIESYFFPHLISGVEAYLKAYTRRDERYSVYLSSGFAEHMRNWQQAGITNYRGDDKEQVEDFLQDFYSRFVREFKKQMESGKGQDLLRLGS